MITRKAIESHSGVYARQPRCVVLSTASIRLRTCANLHASSAVPQTSYVIARNDLYEAASLAIPNFDEGIVEKEEMG